MSYSNQHAEQYRKNAVAGATPLQLIVMLYDGALRFLNQAQTCMRQGDYFHQNEAITKAQRILTELMSCLDQEKGGEIADNLMALYSYTYDQTVQANTGQDEEALQRAMRVLGDLRASWSELDAATRAETTSAKAA